VLASADPLIDWARLRARLMAYETACRDPGLPVGNRFSIFGLLRNGRIPEDHPESPAAVPGPKLHGYIRMRLEKMLDARQGAGGTRQPADR
jgi:hypothetical protein